MQTPAERYLVKQLVSYINLQNESSSIPTILNAGAGQSVSIEKQLMQHGCKYICDRIDIEDCKIDFPTTGKCWQCSIENMCAANTSEYVAVFANYALEHIKNIRAAFLEIYRVLKPGGIFIATIPNPIAPEIVIAKHTPLWFHKIIRQQHGWETAYAYRDISTFLKLCFDSGFRLEDEKYYSFIYGYLYKYPVIGAIGSLYDKVITNCDFKRFMGNACLVLKKPA